MAKIRDILQLIEEGQTLKDLTESYSEVAAAKLKRIRQGIEQNRNFFNEVAGLYYTVKLISRQKEAMKARGGSAMPSLLKREPAKKEPLKPKTTVSILITSNERFYGSIENNLIEFYIRNSARSNSKRFIIGKTAIDYFTATKTALDEKFHFKKDIPTVSEITNLLQKAKQYDRILVYHAKFQSVLYQQPYIVDATESQYESSVPRKQIDYIFEPELSKILAFFDTQISRLLLEQTFLEAELARTAARLITMDTADSNANTFITEEKIELAKAERSIENASLLEAITANFAKGRHRGHSY